MMNLTSKNKVWRSVLSILSVTGYAMVLNAGFSNGVAAAPVDLSDLPITVTGMTGGEQSSVSCGAIPAVPDLELNLTQASYLQVKVETNADATLWIDGPSDFCVLRDAQTNELGTAGHWPEGLYKIYVGNQRGASGNFSLTLSE